MRPEIIVRREEDIVWDFNGKPSFRIGWPNSCWSREIDPTPAYAHDFALVEQELFRCWNTFPLFQAPKLFLLHRETIERTNGYMQMDYDYDSNDGKGAYVLPTIVLIGKRIPLHPAMTRYLVSHEYGHIAEVDAAKSIGMLRDNQTEEFRQWYTKQRGITEVAKYYGPGQWHKAINEVIANDFRVHVMNRESEFWPHEVERNNQFAKDFWSARVIEKQEQIAKQATATKV